MGFTIKKIPTSFDFTVQITYITYKVHCKFSSLLLWPNYVFSWLILHVDKRSLQLCCSHFKGEVEYNGDGRGVQNVGSLART